jgi:uncharacterized protein YycO
MRKSVLFRKVWALILVATMLLVYAIPVFADGNDLESISQETGIPVSELREIIEADSNVDMEAFKERYLEFSSFDSPGSKAYASSGSGSDTKKMTTAQYKDFKGKALKGNILVSKDQSHYGATHGHAGIVTKSGELTVEALGPDTLSKECVVEGWWSEMYTARIYNHKTCTNTQQLAAADYAYKNLRNKVYANLPNATDQNKLNCATLVYQAYKSQGINLATIFIPPIGNTVVPKTITEDKSLNCKLSVNW